MALPYFFGFQPQLHAAPTLFQEPAIKFNLPDLIDHPLDDIYDEIENPGFSLRIPIHLFFR